MLRKEETFVVYLKKPTKWLAGNWREMNGNTGNMKDAEFGRYVSNRGHQKRATHLTYTTNTSSEYIVISPEI